MKHRKITPIDCNNGNYMINCFLGNFHITKVKINGKELFSLHAFSKNVYAQSLVRKYNSNLEHISIYYKSIKDIVSAIEKQCEMYYIQEIKFFYEER